MRLLVRGAVALLVLFVAYWGWALFGAARLAAAASRGDAQALMERVDLQPLIRSLSSQVSHAYLEENPRLQELLARRQGLGGVVINAAGAEMLLRAFLTPERLAALLARGRADLAHAGDKGAGTLWSAPGLDAALSAHPLQTVLNSRFDGPRNFVVGLDSPDGRYGIHLRLSGLTWRLSGLDLPEPVAARAARLIAERINGAIGSDGG